VSLICDKNYKNGQDADKRQDQAVPERYNAKFAADAARADQGRARLQDEGRGVGTDHEGDGADSGVVQGIRDKQNNEDKYRLQNISKLLYLNLSGHDTDFGQVVC